MTARLGHPRNRALRRAIASRRLARVAWLVRSQMRRAWHTAESRTVRDSCECCGRAVVVTAESVARGAVLTCDCGGGQIFACRQCMRGGYGSDPLLIDPPYCSGGLAGPLAGPERPLPGGERAALLGTVALARSLGGAR